MITTDQVQTLLDNKANVESTGGDKIGTVGQVFLDDATGEPSWVTVKTGLFGSSETFVPLDRATVSGTTVQVPYDKDLIKGAPRVEADQHLSPEEEDELYRYYGLESTAGGYAGTDTTTGYADTTTTDTTTTGTAGTAGYAGTGTADTTTTYADTGTAGRHAAGDTDDDTLVRSEERVDVGTRRREAGKVRLRKYVVTENVTKTVPVTREEVRVEREPVTAGDTVNADLGEDTAEVTLHEDEVVTDKRAVPVEKVRLDTDTVTEDQQVTEQVRKEQVETETDRDRGRDAR
ncbi:PRC and DUF2382 domain-containing protein [Georgenia sp. TF02-10]|uniref:DUF2382 domain-containing protein n=1 Tax=Georgenia sp. TF02-10 TaxID=2917725 RepID=UPI001FA731C2|nr:PRC and DUF2382 domain-containing protein [Georgenia sp. TF02-10]UNX55252.1 PRC and DUF2382 domain-containing protein [Georgenia sp. TF02-10]